jgi:undecaprenyl-diphosphatase
MDQALFHLINQRWTSPALDLFMAALSDIRIWKPLIILAVLYALIFGGFKGRAFVVCIACTVLVSEAIVIGTLKSAVGRLRPKQAQTVRMVQLQPASPRFLTLFKTPTIRYSGERDRKNSGPSFPSGHVTNNFVVATCGTLFFRARGALYFIVAAAVGYSRVYLGAHWPSDVLATAFMAAGETLLIVAVLERLWRWGGGKWAPEVFARHPRLIGNATT